MGGVDRRDGGLAGRPGGDGVMRLCLVFDKVRPDTTGVYFERACQQLGIACDHWWLRNAPQIPSGYDLYLRVDHGEYTVDLPERLRPRVFYAIDTHLKRSWQSIRALARRYDLVCCAQRAAAMRLPGALWVPLGCDPAWMEPGPGGGPWDVVFIGHDGGNPRKFILQAVRERYPNSYVGTAPHTQLLSLYAQGKIGFNYSIRGEINMRVFEVLAAGALLVTNTLPQDEMASLGLREGEHYVAYQRLEDLFACLDAWLADEAGRRRIAQAGAAVVRREHTYAKRLAQVLAAAKDHGPAL
ncbi:MAG: glycosyltransferase family 1 protein [Candidatus Omnitrophica bacterium]|nr:glycosyltransferase family 1 protein [Candidatus Omnitrophota bacterium]